MAQPSKPAKRPVELLDRTPPHNLQAEREALGTMMCGKPNQVGYCFAFLDEQDFHSAAHRVLFKRLKIGWERGVPFDTPGCLSSWIRESGVLPELAECIGVPNRELYEIARVIQSEFMGIHYEYYCKILRGLRCERAAIHIGVEALRDAHAMRPREWLEKLEHSLAVFRQIFTEVNNERTSRCAEGDRPEPPATAGGPGPASG